jgi:hypothetical protein
MTTILRISTTPRRRRAKTANLKTRMQNMLMLLRAKANSQTTLIIQGTIPAATRTRAGKAVQTSKAASDIITDPPPTAERA